MPLEFVDLAAARIARGVRLVVSAAVPSPWSEAAKGLFHLQGVPVTAVRFNPEDPELVAWARSHNVPVVLHEDDPPRVGWAEIVMLAERLGHTPGVLVPTDLERRVRMIGLIHELAGENGLGWSARLLMIEASLSSKGARGFTVPIARYLGARYGYAPGRAASARVRLNEVLLTLRRELGDREYFGVDGPCALDVYSATFLTLLCTISEADCPAMEPLLRRAFASVREDLGGEVDPVLAAHRARMFERHLVWPIAL